MRNLIAGAMGLLLVAGCGGVAPQAAQVVPAPPGAGHDQLVASLNGRYIWNCTLTSTKGAAPWRFVLARQGEGRRSDVVVLEAGNPIARRVEIRRDGAARIYTMRDGSSILVASDGEARGDGRLGSRGLEYTTGRCTKGGQPS